MKKEISKKQKENKTKYRHLYNSMNQGVVYQNVDGYITDANPAAQRLLGLSIEQLQGRKSVDPRWKAIRQDGSDFPGDEHPAMLSLKSGKPVRDAVMGIYHPEKDSHVWILVNAEPIFGDDSIDEPTEVYTTFTDITERIIAEKQLRHQSELQSILTDISGSFINISKFSADEVINLSLKKLGEYLGGDRTYIFDYEHEKENIRNTYEWCKVGIEPQIDLLQETPFSMVPDWIDAHFNGRAMNIPDVMALDKEDGVRQVLEPQGIKSLITIPIIDKEECIGFLGIDSVADHKSYGDIDENILRIYSQLLVNLYKKIEAQKEIKEKQSFMDGVFQSSNSLVAIKSNEGKYLFVNRQWEKMTGLKSEETIGRTDFDFFPPEIAKQFVENDRRAIEEDRIIETEEVLADEDNGRFRYFLSNKFPIKIGNKENKGLCLIAFEITERKKAEKDLQQTNFRLQNLVNSQTNYVVRVDLEGNLNYANRKYVNDFGWLHKKNHIIGSSALLSINDYHHPRTRNTVEFCIQNPGSIKKVELDKPLKNGTIQTTLWEFVCLTDESGNPTELQCMGFDITNEKQVTKKLRQSEKKYKTLFKDSPDGYLILKDDKFIDCNHAAQAILGYENEELIGMSPADISPEFQPDGNKSKNRVKFYYQKAAEKGTANFEWTHLKQNGQEVLLKVSLTEITYDDDVVLFVTWRDITIKKRAEAERIARKEAEAANEAKGKFLSRMSHEIRTPLNAIMSYSHILQRNNSFTKKQKNQLHAIGRSGEHLLQLIEDILDYSKIEANRIEVINPEFSPKQLIDDMELMFHQQTEDKGIYLQTEYNNLPEFISADEGKIRQVLVNIIGNSVKFTDRGGITIKADYNSKSSQAKGRLKFTISDTGPGMTKDEVERIYTEFAQFSAGKQKGGTGLGMPIVRKLIEAMGGTINIDSEPGTGTEVNLSIPVGIVDENASANKQIETQTEKSAGKATVKQNEKIKVLIVDDNEDNRDTLHELIEPDGYDIYQAVDGLDGVEKAKTIVPDIILMDIQMPKLDGYEASQKIKSESFGDSVKIIAVTASEYERDDQKLSQNGLDDYLRKPFQPEDLFEKIRYWISQLE